MTIEEIPTSEYYDNDWFIKDISESENTFGWLTLNVFSDSMEEDVEIASVIANYIDCEEVIETFNVISKANEMHKLLEKCYRELNNENLKSEIKALLERNIQIKFYE